MSANGSRRPLARAALVALLAMAVAACATVDRFSPERADSHAGRKLIGKTVALVLRNGDRIYGVYNGIDAGAIVLEGGHEVPLGKVKQIEWKHVSGAKTVLALGLVFFGGRAVLRDVEDDGRRAGGALGWPGLLMLIVLVRRRRAFAGPGDASAKLAQQHFLGNRRQPPAA